MLQKIAVEVCKRFIDILKLHYLTENSNFLFHFCSPDKYNYCLQKIFLHLHCSFEGNVEHQLQQNRYEVVKQKGAGVTCITHQELTSLASMAQKY